MHVFLQYCGISLLFLLLPDVSEYVLFKFRMLQQITVHIFISYFFFDSFFLTCFDFFLYRSSLVCFLLLRQAKITSCRTKWPAALIPAAFTTFTACSHSSTVA